MSAERDTSTGRPVGPRMLPSWRGSLDHLGPESTRPRHADTGVPPRSPLQAGHSPDPGSDEQNGSDDLVIRPFLLTGGRTRPAREDLHIETLVQARPGAMTSSLRFETRQIVELSQRAISMAEIAAAVRVPLGVARVLVSDLVADGSVTVVQREELSVQLIERIRDRVRAL